MQGLTAPNSQTTGLESPENPQKVTPQGCFRRTLTLYIYRITETGYERIGKASNLYRTDIFGSYERTRDRVIEAAVEIACAELCKHRRGNVIISSMENADKARKDPGRLVYSWRTK